MSMPFEGSASVGIRDPCLTNRTPTMPSQFPTRAPFDVAADS
jgi:hypothetical protein